MGKAERFLAKYQCPECGKLLYCPEHGFRYKKKITRRRIRNIGKWGKRGIRRTEPWLEDVMEDGLPRVAPSVAELEARVISKRGEVPRIVERVIANADANEKNFQCPVCGRRYYCEEHGFNVRKYRVKRKS